MANVPVIRRERGKRLPEGAVYVGRPSRLSNPFVIGRDGTREEVIEKYRAGLAALDPLVLAVRLNKLAARKPTALACWCRPPEGFQGRLLCHAQILAGLLAGVPPETIE